MINKQLLQQALDALTTAEDYICGIDTNHARSTASSCDAAIEALRAAIAQPESEPTIKESLKVHASAEDYLRYKYGAYRGHHAWRELEEAYSQGRYDESMAQGPNPWPDDLNQQPVHRPGTVGIDE